MTYDRTRDHEEMLLAAVREFSSRRDGMIHAMSGGLWLHRHLWFGTPMAHLVSVDQELLLAYGRHVGIPARRLQFKSLKDPRTGLRQDAWHWDLVGPFLPPRGHVTPLVARSHPGGEERVCQVERAQAQSGR